MDETNIKKRANLCEFLANTSTFVKVFLMCLATNRPKNGTLGPAKPPLPQLDAAADFFGKLPVVGGNYQADSMLFVKPEQQILNFLADAQIERSGWLIRQDQLRLQNYRTRHRDALLFASRKLARTVT